MWGTGGRGWVGCVCVIFTSQQGSLLEAMGTHRAVADPEPNAPLTPILVPGLWLRHYLTRPHVTELFPPSKCLRLFLPALAGLGRRKLIPNHFLRALFQTWSVASA